MKLRLLEYIICPDHPDECLQLREGHVAQLFEYSCEVLSPLCKSYCGLAQGRFEKVPQEVVPDCQYCISLDVEWGILQCPICGGFYTLYEGVPVLTHFFPAGTDLAADMLAAEYHFRKSKLTEYRRRGPFAGWADRSEAKILREHLDLESVGSVLYLGGASARVMDLFGGADMETVIACEDPEELIKIDEKEVLCPSRLTYTAISGQSPNAFRRNSFDLVVIGQRLYGVSDFGLPVLNDLMRACKKSGCVALILYGRNFMKRALHLCEGRCVKQDKVTYKTGEFLEQLLGGAKHIEMERHHSALLELVTLRTNAVPPEDVRTPFPGDVAEAMINA